MADDGNVQVFCRVRPPNEREGGATAFTKKCVAVPSADPLQQTVLLQLKGAVAHAPPKTFTFDRVFHELSSQNEVFELVGVPITKACLEGYNGTIFAYGQTGSGKTFTMQGPDDVIDADARHLTERERGLRGLVPRVFDYLFRDTGGATRVAADASSSSTTRVEHTFACSFMEIYNERVYDLLDHGSTRDAAGLTLRENGRKGVSVEGLIESVVTNAKQAAELMAVGARNRRVGQTAMNRESSRSHSVFVLQIQSKETTAEGVTRTRLSRFNLVDLAGSERQKNTEAVGERLKEAGSINKSLSALGNVIMGLVEQSAGKNRHVHYRDSKLTFLLKDSLGGNSKTFMIATVSPAEDSSHETLSTLKFAQRAKLIRNIAVINEDTSGSVLALQEEIVRLRRQLNEAHNGRNGGVDFVREARLSSLENQHFTGIDGAHNFDGLNERLEELEASLGFALEKNESLMRTNGQLSARSSYMEALCNELKRNISSLKLRLRLRSGFGTDDVTEFKSSADAIEWRMKFEELEEAYGELQERLHTTDSGILEDNGSEIQKLNLMYFTLTKQLAHVIREKHEIARKLSDKPLVQDDEDDKLTQLEHDMAQRSVDFEARLNSVLAMDAAAEAKAEAASLELLHGKQKEAAWKIDQQKSEVVIAQQQERIALLEAEAKAAWNSTIEARQQRIELEMRLRQEHADQMQGVENQLADKMTENFELTRAQEQLQSNLHDVLTQHGHLKDKLQACEVQLACLEEEKTKLEETIVTMKSKITTNAAEKTQLLSVQESNNKLIDELTSKCAKLDSDVAKYCKLSDEKSAKIDELLVNLKETRDALEKEHELCHVATTNLAAANVSLIRAKSDNQSLTDNVEGLQLEALKLKERIGTLQEEVAKSADLLQITEEAVRDCKEELAERSEDYKNQISGLKTDCDDLVAQREKAIADSEQSIAELRERHRKEVDEVNWLSEQAANKHKGRVEELQAKIMGAEERLATATQEHKTLSDGLRLKLEATETSLVAEKQLRADDREESQRQRDDLVLVHDEKVESLYAAAIKQKSEHHTAIAALTQSVEMKSETITKCDATIAELGPKILTLESELSRAESIVSELRSTLRRTEAERDEQTSCVNELEDKLTAVTEERSAAERQIQKLIEDVATHKELIRQREETLSSRLKQIADLDGQLDHITKENEKLCADLEHTRQVFDETVAAHKASLSSLHAAEVAKLANEEALAAKVSELNDCKQELEALRSELSDSLKNIAKTEEARVSQLALWEKSETAFNGTIKEKSETIAKRDATIAELGPKILTLESELSRAESIVSELRSTLRRTEAERDEQTSCVNELEDKLTAVTEERSAAERQIQKLIEDVATHKELIRQREETLSSRLKQIADLDGQLDHITKENEKLCADLEHTRQVFDETVAAHKASLSSLHATEVAKLANEEALAAKVSELNDCKQELEALRSELSDSLKNIAKTEEARVSQLALWEKSETAFNGTIKELRQHVDDQRQAMEQEKKEAEENVRAIESETGMLRQELDHSVQKVSRQRRRIDTLVETNAQLSRDVEDKASAVSETEQKLLVSREQQSTTEAELQQIKLELAASKDEFAKLKMMHDELSTEYNSVKDDLKKKQAYWTAKNTELNGRTSVVGEMEVQIADESKKLTDEKIVVAQRKKQAEKIKREYEQLKVRVEDLETLKIQLLKEKDKYRREVNVLTHKLDQISKENDKLVGHDNKRQKIQHHIRVKEENNRLQLDVRLLTEEKLKLEVRIERLERTLKEKENLVNDAQIDLSRSPSSIRPNSNLRNLSSSTVVTSTVKTTESGSLESSARKRLRSRLE